MANKKKKKVTSKKKTTSKKKKSTKKSVNRKVTNSKSTNKKKTTSKKSNTGVKSSSVKKVEKKEKLVPTNEEVIEPKVIEVVPKKVEKKEKVVTEETPKKVNTDVVLSNDISIKEEKDINKKNIINSYKKYIKFFVIVLVIIILVLLMLFFNKKRNIEEITFEKINLTRYLKLYEEKNNLEFVYLSSRDCISCDTYESNLKRLEEEYKISIKELEVTDMTSDEIEKIRKSNLFLTDSIEIPALISIKDGESLNGISGTKEYNALKRFIEYSKNPTGVNFIKISVSKYLNLLNSKDKSIIYIGESSDNTCEEFSKVLEKVMSKNGLKVYYLDTNEIITEENWDKLNNSNDIFKGIWFKPTIIITKNGKIVDYKMESMNEADLTKFLSKNGF